MPPLAVTIPQNCEQLAEKVAHYPAVPGKTDARVAYAGERSRLDTANERLAATRGCQELQRKNFEAAK
jgi:hypothetical protein